MTILYGVLIGAMVAGPVAYLVGHWRGRRFWYERMRGRVPNRGRKVSGLWRVLT